MRYLINKIMEILGNKNTITIIGKSIDVVGNKIKIRNNSVFVDGIEVESGLSGIVKIEFTGDLAKLDCTSAVINGSVLGDVDGTNITVIGDVQGDIDGTNIKCGSVGGDVDGTTITISGDVKGDVDAMNFKKK